MSEMVTKEITIDNYKEHNEKLFNYYDSKFAVINNNGKKVYNFSVRWSDHKFTTKSNRINVPEYSFDDFIYFNKDDLYYSIDKDKKLVSTQFAPIWLSATKMKFSKGEVFNPTVDPDQNEGTYHYDGYYNTFNFNHLTTIECKSYPEDWEPQWLKLYRDTVFKNMPEQWTYIIKWMAHRVQKPGEMPRIGVLMTGSHGVGKDVLVLPLLNILGPHAKVIKKWDEIFGKNNQPSANKIFLHVTENSSEFRPEYNEAIKIFVNNDEPSETANKWVKIHSTDNYHGLTINMNSVRTGMKMRPSERRWVVINFPTHEKTIVQHCRDQEIIKYWETLVKEIKENTQWFYDYFMDIDITDWSPECFPSNNYNESLDLMRNSIESHELFLLDLLSNDTKFQSLKGEFGNETLNELLQNFCKTNSYNLPNGNKLNDLLKDIGVVRDKFRIKNPANGKSEQVRGWKFPPLEQARINFENKVMLVWSVK